MARVPATGAVSFSKSPGNGTDSQKRLVPAEVGKGSPWSMHSIKIFLASRVSLKFAEGLCCLDNCKLLRITEGKAC